jgi:hypothetical protein
MNKLKALWAKFLSLKIWQKALVILLAYVLFASATGFGSSDDSSENDSKKSSATSTRSYPVEYLSHADINPATVSVRFGIKNDGTQPMTPSCKIKMQDASGTYKGYDFFDITDSIAPGQTKQIVVQLTITNEGAAYVDQFIGDCTAETSDSGSSAGKAVVISDIKNCSDNDEDGWYWGACFKSDQEFMTQMDCTIKGLDINGKEVGTHSYRANTVNNGTVVSYGQDVRWYVMSTKSIVQSIKSFDVKCTL